MLAANDVVVMIDGADRYTPTPAVSHAIVAFNRGRDDVKQKEPKYANPYPEGTAQHAEYHRGYRENAGY